MNLLNQMFLIFEFELKSLLNTMSAVIRIVLIEPLVYVLLLGAGLNQMISWESQNEISYITYIFPGIISLQALKIFHHSLCRLTVDRRWGLQAIKMVSGIHKVSYIVGMSMIPALVFFIQSITAYSASIFLGTKFDFIGFTFLTCVGLIASLFWTMLALSLCFFIKNYSQRDLVLSFLILPLSFSAPVFYSLDKAPTYLKLISWFNPITYQTLALREAYINHSLLSNYLFILLFSTFVLFSLSFLLMKNAEYLPSEV